MKVGDGGGELVGGGVERLVVANVVEVDNFIDFLHTNY